MMVSKIFIFTPIPGEMFQFDEHIFQTGWNHQPDHFLSLVPLSAASLLVPGLEDKKCSTNYWLALWFAVFFSNYCAGENEQQKNILPASAQTEASAFVEGSDPRDMMSSLARWGASNKKTRLWKHMGIFVKKEAAKLVCSPTLGLIFVYVVMIYLRDIQIDWCVCPKSWIRAWLEQEKR